MALPPKVFKDILKTSVNIYNVDITIFSLNLNDRLLLKMMVLLLGCGDKNRNNCVYFISVTYI